MDIKNRWEAYDINLVKFIGAFDVGAVSFRGSIYVFGHYP